MNMDTTINKTFLVYDPNVVSIKKVQHNKHWSNQGRIKDSHRDKNGNLKTYQAYEDHEVPLKFFLPYLELLPDPQLHHPAKELALFVFTMATTLKQRKESLTLTTSSLKIPSSAQSKLELTSSPKVKSTPGLNIISSNTSIEVSNIQSYLKTQIITVQKLEYTTAR